MAVPLTLTLQRLYLKRSCFIALVQDCQKGGREEEEEENNVGMLLVENAW